MKRGWRIGLVFVFILSVLSCQTLMKNSEASIYDLAYDRFDHDLYRLFIKFRFNTGSNPDTILSRIQHPDSLAYFYAQRDYKPIWTRNILNHSIIDTINGYFKNAWVHGLQSGFYHSKLIDQCLEEYISSITTDTAINYLALANLELLISDALLIYRNHLIFGAVNPTELYPEAYHLPMDQPETNSFFNPLHAKNIVNYLEKIQPKNKSYTNLQKALAKYKSIQVQGGWKTINVVFMEDEKLAPGDTAYFIDQLAARLKITGELDNRCNMEALLLDSATCTQLVQRDFPDSMGQATHLSYYIYTPELAHAIEKFQSQNGIYMDGVIGNMTISRLNIPVQERISQIIVNLERLRWFDYPEDSKYVLVNIPDFRLFVFDKGEKQLDMKVCVGKTRDRNYEQKLEIFRKTRDRKNFPNNNETPLLHGYISHFVLNPKWNVPDNIGKNEIYWKVLNDPEYLSKRNFKVYFNGNEVSADSIDWANYSADGLPFRFQQDASEGNALGKVKFIFENNYNIYLHDTPSKQAFGYTCRAVSHGCIRLEKPLELAEYLTMDSKNLDYKDINTILGANGSNKTYDSRETESRHIILEQQIPLYINYLTSWIDEEGNLHFRDDVYQKDELLIGKLM